MPEIYVPPDESSAAFIKALRQLDVDWKVRLPMDAQLVFYVILMNGRTLELFHITEEGYHTLRIQGRDEHNEQYVLIAHQATVQILCQIAKVTPERPRRQIGFGPREPEAPQADAS